jgi:hypothetical protein
MKIKITDKIAVNVRVNMTNQCPAGTAYYSIDYMVDGFCIHTATTGAIYGEPNVIAMLDREFTKPKEYHYQDIENPDPKPETTLKGHKYQNCTVNGRDAWYEEVSITHRQAIIDACKQIVIE